MKFMKTKMSELTDKLILENGSMSNQELQGFLARNHKIKLSIAAIKTRKSRLKAPKEKAKELTYVERKEKSDATHAIKKEADKLIEENKKLRTELEAVLKMSDNKQVYVIPKPTRSKTSNATIVAMLSDIHFEEQVRSNSVNGMNEYNLSIAEQRIKEFFINTVKLAIKEQAEVNIETMILAILGDLISGNIHDELLETCQLRPVEAMIAVTNLIGSGIQYILDNTNLKLVIPCTHGNHGRMTKKIHISTESGNSLEYFSYWILKDRFASNPRVKFIIAESYHVYVEVYGYTLRFHHGTFIKYSGGVGGIFISTYKAINQWNKFKDADWDFFGHHHQMKFGGNFICNGSIIGYSPFAISIKADFEKPKQSFCLIDEKRGLTGIFPILFSV